MKYLSSFSLYFFILMLSSCSDTTYDDIQANEDTNSDLVTYQDVKPIIDNNCLNCHGNPTLNAPMSLTTYDEVKTAIESFSLKTRVENGSMPPGGSISETDKIKLIDWIDQGYSEN